MSNNNPLSLNKFIDDFGPAYEAHQRRMAQIPNSLEGMSKILDEKAFMRNKLLGLDIAVRRRSEFLKKIMEEVK